MKKSVITKISMIVLALVSCVNSFAAVREIHKIDSTKPLKCALGWWRSTLLFFLLQLLFSIDLLAGIKSTSGNIVFDSNSDGVSEAVLSSDGLAIGPNLTPSANLHVQGNSIISGDLYIGGTTGSSNLNLHGSMGYSVETISDNTTLGANSVVLVNTGSGNITVTLPFAGNAVGSVYSIKQISSSYQTTVSGIGFIDSYDNVLLTPSDTVLPYLEVVSDGEKWLILGERGMTDPIVNIAGSQPSLDFAFAGTESLIDQISNQDLITFTRASTATYIDNNGTIQTAAVNEARFNYDPSTGECLGLLLEPSRTNLVLSSNTLATQDVTVSATVHTLHFTGTGTVTLSGVATDGPLVGTGTGEANRVSLSFTPTAGTLTLTVSGTVTNAQLEAGAFASSYIPTAGSQITRSADLARVTGTNFSNWYSSTEGTFYVNASLNAVAAVQYTLLAIENASDADFVAIARRSNSGPRLTGNSSFDQPDITLAAWVNGSRKLAAAMKLADSAIAADGSSGTNSDALVPSGLAKGDELTIGLSPGGGHSSGFWTIKRIVYWSSRLSNATLETITQ